MADTDGPFNLNTTAICYHHTPRSKRTGEQTVEGAVAEFANNVRVSRIHTEPVEADNGRVVESYKGFAFRDDNRTGCKGQGAWDGRKKEIQMRRWKNT